MTVTRKSTLAAIGCAAWLVASAGAWSQEPALDQQLTGSWTLSKESANSGGLGPSAKGMLIFADRGFMLQIVNANMKPFSADDWRNATAAESQASGRGSLAYFGTYEASGADHTLTLHILRSSYPNWMGTDQEWTVSLAQDELTLTDTKNTTETLVWKRLPPASQGLQLRGGRRVTHF
jgi:lipocalin-like protein